MIHPSLSACPLFSGMSVSDLEEFCQTVSPVVHSYGSGQCIALHGEPFFHAAVILEGGITVSRIHISGSESTVAHLAPGSPALFFEAISGLPLNFSYTACKKTRLLLLPVRSLTGNALFSYPWSPIFQKNLTQFLSGLSMNMSRKISILTMDTLTHKVLALLELFAPPGDKEIILPMSRKEMAQYLSVNRSALSRALTDMKKEGLILWNRNHFLLLYRDSVL